VIKAEFSASLLQSSVSHDPSEIMICCSRNIYKENIILWKPLYITIQKIWCYQDLKSKDRNVFTKYV